MCLREALVLLDSKVIGWFDVTRVAQWLYSGKAL
jgi:hypothetical protein